MFNFYSDKLYLNVKMYIPKTQKFWLKVSLFVFSPKRLVGN